MSSGQNFDQALIAGLPMASNMPILLSRFAQGVVSPTTQVQVISGQIDGPTNAAGSVVGGVGGFNYTIDGATNAGSSRRIASSPNADMIEEMRVETSNFDASQGHGTGGTIAMMTRAGSNSLRGTANYQYWTNKINSLNPQQKLAFSQRPETGKIYEGGYENYLATTLGGPVVIPRMIDGRNKLFFFANYQRNYDNAPAQSTPTSTVPANEKHLNGDFSDLLALPNGSQYQIYDPLTARPDPARPGSVIRTPFPNNIIPRDRFMNPNGTYKSPLFELYRDMVPAPNQNFVEQGQEPSNNYYQGGIPNQVTAQNFGGRVDYNHSSSDRFFFRASGTTFYEYNVDWTYKTKYAGLHANDKTRASWSYTGNWTKVRKSMVIDTQVSANRFYEDQQRRGLHGYKPTDVGLPSYLDEYCQSVNNCMLPTINVAGYQGVSTAADGGLQTTNLQVQSNVSSVVGTHTFRGGLDYRLAMRKAGLMAAGNVSSSYNFDTLYTRAADTTAVFPASNIGLSLASLMLGIPSSVSIGENAPISMTNPYYGAFLQDTWRVRPNFTLNFGLRYEYENGIRESDDRWVTEFDPDARLAITDLAQAAYARNPIPQVPVSDFRVLGGSVYAGAPGASGLSWLGESMWMPRLSGAYTIGERTVLKGGYGLFFDTLNAGDYTGFNQTGYSSATTNVTSTDFGRTWLLGDPANGISPLTDPFPVRADGSRFEQPLEDALGVDAILGTNFTREDPHRKHPRVQRWRAGVQQELLRNLAVEIAYTGAYIDRVGRNIAEVYVPEQYLQQRDQRPRRDPADTAPAAGAEPVHPGQLRLAGDHGPGAVPAARRQLVLHRGDSAAASPAARLPSALGPDLCQPPARDRQGSRAGNHRHPPLPGGAERQPRLRRAAGHREPHGRDLRSGADALADEPERATVAAERRRGLRAAVRPQQAVPQERSRQCDPRWLADRRHRRIPARRAPRLAKHVLQRRLECDREEQAGDRAPA